MTWNYRIVKYSDGRGYGLHEVHYNVDDTPKHMIWEPMIAVDEDEGPAGIIKSLTMMLADAQARPVFEEPAAWRSEEDHL